MTRPVVTWRLCSTAILSLVSSNTFHRNEAFVVDSWRVGFSSPPTLLRQVQRRGTRPSPLDAHQSRSRAFAGSATRRAWGQRGPALLTGERFFTTARMSTGQQVEKGVETIGAKTSANAGEDVTDDLAYARWPTSNRVAIGALACAGALESAYLTYEKLRPAGLEALCGTSGGCADVLGGPYSSVLGIPLTVPGTLGYLAVAGLALVPLLVRNDDLDKQTRSLILVATTTMGVFAVYLTSLLVFKIGYPCPWCLASAGLSWTMCAVAWMRKAVPEKTKAAVMGFCTAAITGLACLTIFVVTQTAVYIGQADAVGGRTGETQLIAAPPIETESSAQALRIAKKLKSLDAKMYGAYWCTHCFNQKQLLGKEAMSKVKYVECSSRGVDNQVGLCKAANIPGYPTWDIGGTLYPGEQTLEELEQIVGLAPSER